MHCYLQAAGSSQSGSGTEQGDGGTGNWRGMLKKGDEGISAQGSFLASPQRGHAVNLLDVVRTPSLFICICLSAYLSSVICWCLYS